jgi:hypothetical protein
LNDPPEFCSNLIPILPSWISHANAKANANGDRNANANTSADRNAYANADRNANAD